MNEQLKSFAVLMLTDGLNKLPAGHQRTFKLMYGRNKGKRSVADAEAMQMDSVIAEIPDDRLDWAMQQVQNSLDQLPVTP